MGDGGTWHQEKRKQENTIEHVGIARGGGVKIVLSKSRRGSERKDVWRSEIKREKSTSECEDHRHCFSADTVENRAKGREGRREGGRP